MKNLIYLVFFLISLNNIKAQDIAPLLQDFTNIYALSHSETYRNTGGEEINRSNYINTLNNFIKMKDVDPERLNSITSLVRNNPSVLKPYLESNTHVFAAFLLLLDIYNIELQGDIEKFTVNAIYGNTFNESLFGNIPPNEILNNAWIETRESSINRVKLIVGIN